MEHLSTYFLGALIIDHQALGRVNPYRRRLLGAAEEVGEGHITVFPPFRATYKDASSINMDCGCASIKSNHPMNSTIFEMRGLEILEFEGEGFLVFPLQAYTAGEEQWGSYVLRVRQRLKDAGIAFKDAIPQEYRPHMTLCRMSDISNRINVEKIVAESKKELPLYFRTAYLTLYAKYKKGYAAISGDPSCE